VVASFDAPTACVGNQPMFNFEDLRRCLSCHHLTSPRKRFGLKHFVPKLFQKLGHTCFSCLKLFSFCCGLFEMGKKMKISHSVQDANEDLIYDMAGLSFDKINDVLCSLGLF